MTDYLRGQVVQNDGSSYICKADHTSAAGNEPGVGGSWTTYWDLLAAAGVGITDGDKGDVVVSSAGATWTVENNAITDAKLRDSAALSVIGRASNTSGDPADIVAANDGEVLRRNGTSVGWGTIATAGIADGAVTNAKQASMTAGRIKGRKTADGDGAPQDLTAAEARTELGLGTAALEATSAFAAASHAHSGADITSGTVAAARLGSGTPTSSTYLRGDGAWSATSAFASATHTHAAADVTSGVFAVDRLATGSASSSTYLRGDGVWSAISAFATATHTHAAADITSGVFAVARLGTGTPSSGTYLRGDGQWIATSNFAAASHTHNAADITTGTMATARLGSGTADSTTFLRGDGTWAVPPTGGGGGVEFGVAKKLAHLRL